MKKLILIVGVLFAMQSLSSQSETLGDWIVSFNAGIAEHDKRNFKQERLLTMPSEKFGTYHAGVLVQRKLVDIKRLRVFGGLGFNYEQATMRRTFNHCHFYEVLFKHFALSK